jgi:integrase
MPRKGSTPHLLLSDPDVRRWYENLARGSEATAEVNLRRLAALCASLKTTPSDLAKLDEKELHDKFLDFVSAEEKRNVAGSYIVRTMKAGKSWLLHNGKKLQRPIKVRGSKDTPSLRDERVPTQEELRNIILAGTPRIRVTCALIAFSGLRPEVMGNYLGTDGLTIADLPELTIRKDTVEFSSIPTVIRIRPELSKNSNGYLTFLSGEGCDYVKQYLEERIRSGEKLAPDSDLVHPDRAHKKFIRTLNIGDAIRTAIRGAGYSWRPYVLRHYFDTQLLTAESKGKVAHDFRVYWMGHTGSIDVRYTTNKRQLPKAFVEEMRAAYKRCEPLLTTVQRRDAADPATISKTLLMSFGYSEEEVAEVDLTDLAVVQQLVAKKMGLRAADQQNQKLVSESDLPRYLAEGWKVVTSLSSNQVVLDPPCWPVE